jgi:hypothetical protein
VPTSLNRFNNKMMAHWDWPERQVLIAMCIAVSSGGSSGDRGEFGGAGTVHSIGKPLHHRLHRQPLRRQSVTVCPSASSGTLTVGAP